MKNLKTILLISSLIIGLSFAADDDETRTIEKDGTLYKINNSSLHITPYSEDNAIANASNDKGASELTDSSDDDEQKKSCDLDIDVSFGTQMALGDHYTEITDPGTSMGITFHCPKNINLLGQDFTTAYELSFSNLAGINREDISFNSASFVLGSSLDQLSFLDKIPVTFNFYAGLATVDGDNDTNDGTYLSLGTSVNYKLPIEKCDLSLSLKFNQITNSDNTYGLYSAGLSYGKTLSCSR